MITSTSNPKTCNPLLSKETSTEDVVGQMFSSMVRRNQPTLEWKPRLAES